MVEISPEHSLDDLRNSGDDIEETPEEQEDLVVEEKLPVVNQDKLVTGKSDLKYGLNSEQEVLAREIWDKYKGEYSPKYIFLNYMKDFFDVQGEGGKLVTNTSWINFVSWLRIWKGEDQSYVAKVSAANLSDEEVEKINETNAKELVVLLQNTIAQYQKKPETFKKLSFGDISKLYQIIKQIQGASERLELQRNKLKLEAAKTFLPYTRMDMNQLEWAQKLINKGIDQLKKNNAKKLPASESGEGGEQQDVE